MNHYIAVFFPASEGGYSVRFPDVPEAITQGHDLAEAMAMARDALGVILADYARAGEKFPAPGGLRAAMAWAEKESADGHGIDQARETLYPVIPAPEVDETPVRVMVSFTRRDLSRIDERARRAGLPRSKFLARAALGA